MLLASCIKCNPPCMKILSLMLEYPSVLIKILKHSNYANIITDLKLSNVCCALIMEGNMYHYQCYSIGVKVLTTQHPNAILYNLMIYSRTSVKSRINNRNTTLISVLIECANKLEVFYNHSL